MKVLQQGNCSNKGAMIVVVVVVVEDMLSVTVASSFMSHLCRNTGARVFCQVRQQATSTESENVVYGSYFGC
jgi:hypothetical protein